MFFIGIVVLPDIIQVTNERDDQPKQILERLCPCLRALSYRLDTTKLRSGWPGTLMTNVVIMLQDFSPHRQAHDNFSSVLRCA